MYTIYKQVVLGEDTTSRALDSRVTRTLGIGQHTVRIRGVDVVGNMARVRMVNQFDEVHTEPVPVLDGDDRISWTLWRLLAALMQDRSETFRARSSVVADKYILEQLKDEWVTVHVVHGRGYRVVRGANDRYWVHLMPEDTQLNDSTFPTHGAAQQAAELAGYPPSQYVVGRWESASRPDIHPFRFRRSD